MRERSVSFAGLSFPSSRIFFAWSTAMGGETWDPYLRLQTVLLRIFASAMCHGRREGSIPKDDAGEALRRRHGARNDRVDPQAG